MKLATLAALLFASSCGSRPPKTGPEPPKRSVTTAPSTSPSAVVKAPDPCGDVSDRPVAESWWSTPEAALCPDETTRVDPQAGTLNAGKTTRCVDAKGIPHGTEISMFEGRLSVAQTYCRGVLHGPATVWNGQTGKLWVEGQYREGKEHGHWREYYPTGELKDELEYAAGELDGTEKHWSLTGALVHARVWRQGTMLRDLSPEEAAPASEQPR